MQATDESRLILIVRNLREEYNKNKCLIIGISLCVIIMGCGKSEESLAKKAGNKVGGTIAEFTAGVGSGIDEKMTGDVELTQDLQNKGMSKTISKSLGIDSKKKGVCVYFISKNPLTAKFMARAFNKDGLEIGRSKVKVSFEKDDAKYVTFIFDDEMDTALVKKHQVDIVK